ncbi:UDP-N-acetylmuramoyl-L-alanyl-D-glutamate--2,6-diaminopimelate ligase [Agaribacter flavus]|uniref:UDP-N-acetylmuramyl-tripeptide synthetase n=1 Tax=Agaribacter flavus TaxID=1902781 RepID=A0ABV7FKX5_9ALTE
MLCAKVDTSQVLLAISHLGFSLSEEEQLLLSAIEGFTADSRQASPSIAFLALQGVSRHGREFIEQAKALGTVLIIEDSSESDADTNSKQMLITSTPADKQVLHLSVVNLAGKLSSFFATLYPQLDGFKQIVAVTGTNGKTSVASFYAQLAASIIGKAASIGTLGTLTYDNDGEERCVQEAENTTPERVSLLNQLAWLAEQGYCYVAIEASSHGIEQGRLTGLPIDTAIFTNLSQDHLDYHGSMQAYGAAKRALLNNTHIQNVIVNFDDPESALWQQSLQSQQRLSGFTLLPNAAKDSLSSCMQRVFSVSNTQYLSDGLYFSLFESAQAYSIHLGLIGDFNIANYLAAIAAFRAASVDMEAIALASPRLKGAKGRMEIMASHHAQVIVDFAHTPDALKQALQASRKHTKGSLWVVFGCGGNRDKEKRPLMGSIAVQFADKVILTQDNSRFEKPEDIVEDVLSGIAEGETKDQSAAAGKVISILDRCEAVKYALSSAQVGDVVLIAGKGHENYLDIQGKKITYDERAFVQQLAEEYI